MFAAVFRRCSAGAALLGLLALARAGGAQQALPSADASAESPLGLTWVSSDPSCDGSAVAARAVELVAAGVTPRPTQARAQVSRDGAQWLVDLQTRSESQVGRRTLRGESCKELQQAIALLLAMIMESEARAEVAQPLPAAPPSPVVVPGATLNTADPEIDRPQPPPPPRAPRGDGFGLLLRVEGTATLGLQPALGLGVSGSIGAAYGPFELHVGGGYWPTSRTPVLDRDGFFEMSRKVLGASACVRIWEGMSFRVLSCAGPEWMWLKHGAVGLDDNLGNEHHGVPALTASIELRAQLIGPLFFTLTPGLTWERSRPFSANSCEGCATTQVFHTWPLGPRLGAGIGARF